MQMLINCLMVGAGGALGSIARYLVTLTAPTLPRLTAQSYPGTIASALAGFPFATLFINIAGSFLIGVIAALCLRPAALSDEAVLFFKVGLCGGFTTFSTFSLETMQLMQSGHAATAIVYAITSAAACVIAAFAGHFAACALQAR